MKKIAALILVQLTLIFLSCYAQGLEKNKIKMNKEVKKIVALGKDSIIKNALTLIDKKARLENFTNTSIQTNGTEINVVFSNSIIYLPNNSIFYVTANINLNTKAINKGTVANPIGFHTKNTIPYYTQTEETKRNIEFVIKAIETSDKPDIILYGGMISIREKKEYYAVSVSTEDYESWCRVKKISGEVYNEGYAQLAPQPYDKNEEEAFKEILFDDNKE